MMLQFDGPKFVYDVGKAGLSTTAHCQKCHKQTYYCQHQIAYCANNPELKKVFEQKINYPTNSNTLSELTATHHS